MNILIVTASFASLISFPRWIAMTGVSKSANDGARIHCKRRIITIVTGIVKSAGILVVLTAMGITLILKRYDLLVGEAIVTFLGILVGKVLWIGIYRALHRVLSKF